MKIFIFLFLFYAGPLFADFLDEQELSNEAQNCKIHYLTEKTKNLWTIDVDPSYCKNGFVQGFTSVTIKDSLARPVRTLHGFFHQGYWLSDFAGEIHSFYRSSPEHGVQDFIFKTREESELNLTYYIAARSIQAKDKQYSVFNICSDTPILLVAHEPTEDFKQSLFQSAVLKSAQQHLLSLCPQTQKLQILGLNNNTPDPAKIVFQADINLQDESITISYHTPINTSDIPHPTELRHEQGENLLTVHPQEQPIEPTQEIAQKLIPQTKEKQHRFQSATDLALITQITGQTISGEAIVYVSHMDNTQSAIVTRPIPLILKSQTALSSGWYIIQGNFVNEQGKNIVQLSSSKLCQKEWCTDEN